MSFYQQYPTTPKTAIDMFLNYFLPCALTLPFIRISLLHTITRRDTAAESTNKGSTKLVEYLGSKKKTQQQQSKRTEEIHTQKT